MEQIGVAAVVQELSSFLGDMGRIDSAIQSVIPTSKLLGGAFDWLGGVVSNFVSGAARVLEYTLGGLIKDAIEAVAGAIRDLIGEIITAGSEFQTLSIRLTGLNLPENAADITDWSAAMAEAGIKTKEQLNWLQALATATPFDATDIATTYSLARSYGFADDEARRLTEDITSFVAGMGLGSEVIERVILNLGQMVQRGKITGTEIRDLARGAFLPLDDVLRRVAKSMGITIEALTAKISTKEGVPAQIFIDAFQEMIETEPRFVGAAGRLARAFEPAINNVKDLFRNIGGLNIVAPVLDVLGEHVAKLVDEFVTFNKEGDLVKTQKWTDLQNAAKGVGDALASLVTDIINIFIPNTSSMADGMIAGLKEISTWITENKPTILAGIQEIKDYIFGTETKKGAIQNFFDWLGSPEVQGVFEATKNLAKDLMTNLFGGTDEGTGEKKVGILQKMYDILVILGPVVAPLIDLFDSIGNVIATAFGGTETQTFSEFVTETLIPGIKDLTKWFDDNKESIAELLGLWLRGAVILLALSGIVAILAGFVTEVVSLFVGWITTDKNWLTVMYIVAIVAGLVALAVNGLLLPILLVGLAILGLIGIFTYLKGYWTEFFASIGRQWQIFKDFIVLKIEEAKTAIQNKDWLGLGKAIVTGIIVGIGIWISGVGVAMINGVVGGYNALMDVIGKKSLKIGKSISDGIADGISGSAGSISNAVSNAVENAYNSAAKVLHSNSPSLLFAELGGFTMEGMAQGIEASAGLASAAMARAVGSMTMPAMAVPAMVSAAAGAQTSNSYSTTNNFSQTVNTSANSEPIISDFQMMASLAGI